MRLFKIILVGAISFSGLLYSCIDSDYHWNNINTEGVLEIPPIPLGSYDTIFINKLNSENIVIEGLPSITVEYAATLRNLFGEGAIKDFFYEDMQRDLSIEGTLDVHIEGGEDDFDVSIDFEVLDSNNKAVEGIDIKGIAEDEIVFGSQDLSIVFPKEDGASMTNAQHLLIKIKLTNHGSITLNNKDYILLSDLVVKTAGFYVDL